MLMGMSLGIGLLLMESDLGQRHLPLMGFNLRLSLPEPVGVGGEVSCTVGTFYSPCRA